MSRFYQGNTSSELGTGKDYIKGLVILASLLLVSGCQNLSTKQATDEFNNRFQSGQYQSAADYAIRAGSIDSQGVSSNLLWSLQAASALSIAGDFQYSTRVFDSAEILMKEENTESLGRKGLETIAATFISNNVNRYTPTVYDGVMVNTYKALNSIFLQDFQNARIEFNRAADRQRRAEESFKERIEEQKEELSKNQQLADGKDSSASQLDMDRSLQASNEAIYSAYPELKEWQAYPDFVNPYTDYLHGLYFMLASVDRDDFGKARQSLRRVAGMTPDNSAVKTDLIVADKLRRGSWKKRNLKPSVWVIFENGEAPSVDELLIPLPLFLVNEKVEYSQIALPRLKMGDQAYPYLEVYSDGKSLGRTELLASMDRVIQTEFKKAFPLKVTEAVASTLTKAFIQYKAREKMGVAGSLIAGVYQATTTRADTRSWSVLPKEVQVSRVRKPTNGKLRFQAPGLSKPLDITLPDSQFVIVYVKASTPGAQLAYQVAGFDA